MTIAEFLLARIAEDETAGQNTAGDRMPAGAWDGFYTWVGRGGARGIGVISQRVLAECEAKRRIIAEHDGAHHCVRHIDPDDNVDCDTIRSLAAVYADHPDYREEWKP